MAHSEKDRNGSCKWGLKLTCKIIVKTFSCTGFYQGDIVKVFSSNVIFVFFSWFKLHVSKKRANKFGIRK